MSTSTGTEVISRRAMTLAVALLRAVARVLCETKPTTAAGVRLIRAQRGRQQPEGDVTALAIHLVKAANAYAASHRGVNREMMQEAFAIMRLAIHDMEAT